MKDKEVRKVPKLRFPGFTDDWEQRKLGDISEFSKGNGYSKADLVIHGQPIILYGRLYTNYETVIRNIDTYVKEKPNSVLSKGGEVIVPASGETASDISRASVVENSGIILGGDLNIISVNESIIPTFLALTISNGRQQKELSKRAQGKSVVHLRNSDLTKVDLLYPSSNEQNCICEFFKYLDNIITLHQRKLENLKNLKKGLLQKMFPKNGEKVPELRFPGFTDDWEQRKLDECFYERTEKQSTGELLSVTIENGVRKFSELLKKDNSSEDKSNYKKVCKGDIAYNSMRMWQGACGKSDYDGLVSPAYTVLVAKINVDSNYMAYMFKTYDMLVKFQRFSQGMTSDTWNLKFNALKKIELYIGSYKEQKEICNIMVMLDNLITLHQRKLEHLQMQKKGLLQQMFV